MLRLLQQELLTADPLQTQGPLTACIMTLTLLYPGLLATHNYAILFKI